MLEQALERYFHFSTFRPGQKEIVESIIAGHDVVALMPTGGGKSLCYQLPALLSDQLTIVISPLIALMKDQVDSLRARGVKAAFLNSTQQPYETLDVVQALRARAIKLLYVAPERFRSPEFRELLSTLSVDLVAVDEAHCVSSWGHDFRPDYLQIREHISRLPSRPTVAAFTATATPEVKDDIIRRLELRDPHVFVRGFDRPNLKFFVRDNLGIAERHAEAIRIIRSLTGSGIVYTITRKETEALAAELRAAGISAAAYHAGLPPYERTRIQNDFQENKFTVIVATIAFGMGVDKADIRFVIHAGMPASLEGYYQEAGRAGRDGEEAYCILLHSRRDTGLHYHFLQESKRQMQAQGRTASEVEQVGSLKYERLQSMVNYSTIRECRRRAILAYFSDPDLGRYADNCASCDVCLAYEWKSTPAATRTRSRREPREERTNGISKTVAETGKLYTEKYTPEQIAKIRSLGVRTIYDHLATWYAEGGEFDFAAFVTQAQEEQVREALVRASDKDRLKSIKEQLPVDITYEQIKFVLAKLRRGAVD